jgi:asparagine synthase (glutamine-hydrolysing)
MCGIFGLISSGKKVQKRQLSKIIDMLAHRGPDSAGSWISKDCSVGLGHRRLSILDLTNNGAQPMESTSGRYVITFNGEIYNFKKLRQELENLNVTFRGHSDTEVILTAIDNWGINTTLNRLRGMFAIGVWDNQEKALILARDRVGIKPLYYGFGKNGFCFSSELKPMVIWQGEMPQVSSSGLTEFLRFGYVPAPLSIFQDTYKLLPGHSVIFCNGKLEKPQPFWELGDIIKKGVSNPIIDQNEALKALELGLQKSVSSHMISDVPLGAFLSGGVDSSLVTSMMQSMSNQPVNTFSIGFFEKGFNEAKHAASVAHHLGTSHTELYLTNKDAQDIIPTLPKMYDEPFADQSQIPTFLVSSLARKHVKVVLSGDGGDELFAGYNRYLFVKKFWHRLQTIPLPLRKIIAAGLQGIRPNHWDKIFAAMSPILPESFKPALPSQKIHKIASILPTNSLLALHGRLSSQWANPSDVLNLDFYCKESLWLKNLHSLEDISDVEQQMYWDAQTYMVDDILTKVDRASMRVGLEARVPLLDHEIVELAWRIPLSMKLKDGESKWILKQLLYKYVPKKLIDRPKMGFSVPIDEWLRTSLKDWAENLLDRKRLEEEGYFLPNEVIKTWKAHQSGNINAGGPLWTLLMFQSWLDETKTWL